MSQDKRAPEITRQPGQSDEDALAHAALRPTGQVGASIQCLIHQPPLFSDLKALVQELGEQVKAVASDNLSRSERMLVAQAQPRDVLFHTISRRAAQNFGHYPGTAERCVKLALKARNQCRANWKALSDIKHPPMAKYVGPANIAHNQQSEMIHGWNRWERSAWPKSRVPCRQACSEKAARGGFVVR